MERRLQVFPVSVLIVRRLAILAAIVGGSLGGATYAQVAGSRALASGAPIAVAAATDRVDYFHFLGLPGELRTISLTGDAKTAFDIFDAEGNLLDSGTDRLEFVPPFAELYTVAVARTGPARGYRIGMTTKAPTAVEYVVASGVGYRSKVENIELTSCWVRPGREVRIVGSTMRADVLLAAGAEEYLFMLTRPAQQTLRVRVAAEEPGFRVTDTAPDGKRNEKVVPYDKFGRTSEVLGYSGYRCPAG